MATPELVETDIKVGAEAAAALRDDPILKPKAAMWVYDDGATEWRFLVATADAVHRGPKAAYLRVRSLLKRNGLLKKLPLGRVIVTHPSHPLVTAVGKSMYLDIPNGAVIHENVFDGVFITGMYIYYITLWPKLARSGATKPPHSKK